VPSKDSLIRESPLADSLSDKSESATRLTEWWGKMPESVLRDTRLRAIDVRVFGMIALGAPKKRGAPKPVTVGTRSIAEAIGVSQSVVARSVRRLIATEHLLVRPSVRGKRAVYEFVSTAFLFVERRGNGEVLLTGYSGVPKHVGIVPDPVRRPRAPRVSKKATA
jgi:hypothetical protein